ncbi:hypothetical protein BTVI_55878 [Pitangus sulphuratus]|nr:hypothetical protein BTVI_55878 [Pitangus sulphuratus]
MCGHLPARHPGPPEYQEWLTNFTEELEDKGFLSWVELHLFGVKTPVLKWSVSTPKWNENKDSSDKRCQHMKIYECMEYQEWFTNCTGEMEGYNEVPSPCRTHETEMQGPAVKLCRPQDSSSSRRHVKACAGLEHAWDPGEVPKTVIIFQVRPPQCRAEQDNLLPGLAGDALPDPPRTWLALLAARALLTCGQLVINQDPQVPFLGTAFQQLIPQSVCISGITPSQTKSFWAVSLLDFLDSFGYPRRDIGDFSARLQNPVEFETPFLGDQAILAESDDIKLQVTNVVNLASFLEGKTTAESIVHSCLETMEAVYSSLLDLKELFQNAEDLFTDGIRCEYGWHNCLGIIHYQMKVREDLLDRPIERGTHLFTDCSSRVVEGKRRSSYAVVDKEGFNVVESGVLPSDWSAQASEICAVINALQIVGEGIGTIYTDSRLIHCVIQRMHLTTIQMNPKDATIGNLETQKIMVLHLGVVKNKTKVLKTLAKWK